MSVIDIDTFGDVERVLVSYGAKRMDIVSYAESCGEENVPATALYERENGPLLCVRSFATNGANVLVTFLNGKWDRRSATPVAAHYLMPGWSFTRFAIEAGFSPRHAAIPLPRPLRGDYGVHLCCGKPMVEIADMNAASGIKGHYCQTCGIRT
jgi:hypothetical protein